MPYTEVSRNYLHLFGQPHAVLLSAALSSQYRKRSVTVNLPRIAEVELLYTVIISFGHASAR